MTTKTGVGALLLALVLVVASGCSDPAPEPVAASSSPLALTDGDAPSVEHAPDDETTTSTSTTTTSTTTTEAEPTTAAAPTTTSTTTTSAPPPPAPPGRAELVAALDDLCADHFEPVLTLWIGNIDELGGSVDEFVAMIRAGVAESGSLLVPAEDRPVVDEVVSRLASMADGYEQAAAHDVAGESDSSSALVEVIRAHQVVVTTRLSELGVSGCGG